MKEQDRTIEEELSEDRKSTQEIVQRSDHKEDQ